MSDLNNVLLLYEQTPEALQAVQVGEAKISTGGIRRSDGTYLDLAKPASMSVADMLSLFEGKDHALAADEHMRQLDTHLELSSEGMKQIQEIGWLNNAAILRTYTVTYEGFIQTLLGLECVANQINELGQYIRQRDVKDILETAQRYANYIKTDAGNLRSDRFDVTNSNVSEHIDKISAFLKRLLDDAIKGSGDQFVSMQVLVNLLPPFTHLVRMFSAYYYNENKFLPGNYDEWINTISSVASSWEFRNRLTYYINLKATMPYRDRMLLSREITGGVKLLLAGAEFDKRYMLTHSIKDYLALPSQIQKKLKAHDFYELGDGKMCIFV